MFNMPVSRVVRIHKTLYVRIPIDEARRLNLREGQAVRVEVAPLGSTIGEALAELRGKYKGKLAKLTDEELWGA